MSMVGYLCPNCDSYSGEAFEVTMVNKIIDNKPTHNYEWLKCRCGWQGQWKDTKQVEEDFIID